MYVRKLSMFERLRSLVVVLRGGRHSSLAQFAASTFEVGGFNHDNNGSKYPHGFLARERLLVAAF